MSVEPWKLEIVKDSKGEPIIYTTGIEDELYYNIPAVLRRVANLIDAGICPIKRSGRMRSLFR